MANYLTTNDITLDNLNVRNRAVAAVISANSVDGTDIERDASPLIMCLDDSAAVFKAYPPESPIFSAAANYAAPTKLDGLLHPDKLFLPALLPAVGCPGTTSGINLPATLARYGPHPSPSLVQGGPCMFVSGDLGPSGTTVGQVAFGGDMNNSSNVWKVKINPGGAWQSPFHTHGADEYWVCTGGSWIFRYFDQSLYDAGGAYLQTLRPGEAPGANTGPAINFEDRGFPSGPNTKVVVSDGDVFFAKRGTFFEWGSDVAGAVMIVTWTASFLSGAVTWIETALTDLLNGKITMCQFNRYLGMFSTARLTPFVACPL